MSLLELFLWIENTRVGTAIRESLYFFPLVETGHVLGLAISVGTIVWFDLRLLGVAMRHDPVSEVFEQLKHWMRAGFSIMFVTGGLLFWSEATRAYASFYFWLKLALLMLAGLNILVYHWGIDRHRSEWDKAPIPPLSARVAGLISIVLWLGVIAAGRIMAYTF
jgi:hypothetical protein